VWAGSLVDGVELRPSRGSHLLVPAERLGNPRAMVNVPLPGKFGRFVFMQPRGDGLVLIGLTDEPFQGDCIPDAPGVPAGEEAFLLEAVSRALSRPLHAGDVVGRFAGLRPLLGSTGAAGATADISRRHAVLEDASTGAITVVGGKLTTYRQMAQDAVDAVAARCRRPVGACLTGSLGLVGAPRQGAITANPRLVRRYGAEAPEIEALAGGRPELLEPVVDGADVLRIELEVAVEREGALTEEDVLDRRVRLGLVPAWRDEARVALPA
jgi:glycerol-3-phosphate dehydrogenase